MGRDKASDLPLLQCEAARGAAAKLPAATTDKTANTSVNRFIGNDPTFLLPLRRCARECAGDGRTLDVCACEVFHRKGTNCIFTRPSAVIGMGCGASPGGPVGKGVAPRLAFPNEFAR